MCGPLLSSEYLAHSYLQSLSGLGAVKVPNNSFKPNLTRYAGQVGLIQALGL